MNQGMSKKLSMAFGMCLLLVSQSSFANLFFNDVAFQCKGAVTNIQVTDNGPRATGKIRLTVTLPSGEAIESAGTIVIALPKNFDTSQDVNNIRINQCAGQGNLEVIEQEALLDVPVRQLRLSPTDIQLRVGNRTITKPERVGFVTGQSGDPNV